MNIKWVGIIFLIPSPSYSVFSSVTAVVKQLFGVAIHETCLPSLLSFTINDDDDAI